MAFRLINNTAQKIAVKGFAATIALAGILDVFHLLSLTITLPFIMPWLIVWLLGYSAINRNPDNDSNTPQ